MWVLLPYQHLARRFSAGTTAMAVCGGLTALPAARCHAQEPAAPTVSNDGSGTPIETEVTLDLRTRVPAQGKTSALLHSSAFSLRTESGLLPGAVRVNVFGLNQYGAFRWQQATVETEFPARKDGVLPQRVQAGIIRVPFGIYDYRETYASGLIDYPLPRLDYAFNAVDWGAPGVQWTGGTAAAQVEAAAFNGRGMGIWGNLNGVDGGAVRLQTYAPPGLVLGFSGWIGHLEEYPGQGMRRDVRLGGIDWRYTRPHLLLRGEALVGTCADSHTKGAYLDAYYRLPSNERLTLVARAEALKPDTAQPESRQITLGCRWNPGPDWTLAANWRRNNLLHAYHFTWTAPTTGRGDLLFQALRRFTIR
jgi:hypothetical protein